ncbi:AAA family ATPase [Frankia sp. Cj5]|uniref:AAA family ATPase n=1 Tax=Frankia sp. Cj5 TaxID=2880978 RepID=UPI001EF6C6FF|nr:AAA family ATPase [Frankia sp. Cj5]
MTDAAPKDDLELQVKNEDVPTDDGDRKESPPALPNTRPLLTGLHIANFKAFGVPAGGDGSFFIPLAPLTLLYGPNSAGKSTLLQALLVLAQSLMQPARQEWPRLVLNDSLIALGSTREVVHRHQTELTISLGVSWRDAFGNETVAIYGFSGAGGELESIEVLDPGEATTYLLQPPSTNNNQSDQEFLFEISEETIDVFLRTILNSSNGIPDASLAGTWAAATAASIQPLVNVAGLCPGKIQGFRFPGGSWFPNGKDDSEPGSDVAIWLDSDSPWQCIDASARYAIRLRESLEHVLSDVRHLGPGRIPPDRRPVRHDDDGPDGVGRDGGRLFHFLASQREGKGVINGVNDALSRLSSPYQIRQWNYPQATFDDNDVSSLKRHRSKIMLSDIALVRDGMESQLQNVGYGFNHLLPILAECSRDSGRPLLIEQPETHLHPDLQVDLIEELLHSATNPARKVSLPQLVVETHSENMLLRIQALVALQEERAEDIQVITVGMDHERYTAFPVDHQWAGDGELDPGADNVFPTARIRAIEPEY